MMMSAFVQKADMPQTDRHASIAGVPCAARAATRESSLDGGYNPKALVVTGAGAKRRM